MQQDRREVEQQQVLDHVHDEQLLAEAVDRRDERGQHAARARRGSRPGASRALAARPGLARARRRQRTHVDAVPTSATRQRSRPGRERPRVVGRRRRRSRGRLSQCAASTVTDRRAHAWPVCAPACSPSSLALARAAGLRRLPAPAARPRRRGCARRAAAPCRGSASRAARAARCRRRAAPLPGPRRGVRRAPGRRSPTTGRRARSCTR